MTFNDFINGLNDSGVDVGNFGNLGMRGILISMLASSILALYIFLVYRIVTKKTFYSKSFNISLAGITVITAAIILTIQSNIVLSLGMVGALSIVRFRTAIKDPMDLMFLFWAISIGIICGAKLYGVAIILSIVLTIGILILQKIPFAKASMILVVNSSDIGSEDAISEIVKKHSKTMSVKSRNMTKPTLDITYELRTDEGETLIKEITALDCIEAASLLSHDGEVTF